MGQANSLCCNDRNMLEIKRRGEVRLYTKDEAREGIPESTDGANPAFANPYDEDPSSTSGLASGRTAGPATAAAPENQRKGHRAPAGQLAAVLPAPLRVAESRKRFAVQSSLSSHDQRSRAGDLGGPPQTVPVAELLASFKTQIEHEEAEEARKRGLPGRASAAIPDPDHSDALVIGILQGRAVEIDGAHKSARPGGRGGLSDAVALPRKRYSGTDLQDHLSPERSTGGPEESGKDTAREAYATIKDSKSSKSEEKRSENKSTGKSIKKRKNGFLDDKQTLRPSKVNRATSGQQDLTTPRK